MTGVEAKAGFPTPDGGQSKAFRRKSHQSRRHAFRAAEACLACRQSLCPMVTCVRRNLPCT